MSKGGCAVEVNRSAWFAQAPGPLTQPACPETEPIKEELCDVHESVAQW